MFVCIIPYIDFCMYTHTIQRNDNDKTVEITKNVYKST